jgi:hypothetical protein
MRALLLSASLLLPACNASSVLDGSDSGPTRDFSVSAFTGLTLAGPYDVVVTQGRNFVVHAEGDPKVLDRITVTVQDGELWIGKRGGFMSGGSHRKATVYVTVPQLESATIAGSGDMRIDKIQGASFAGTVGGSGNLQINALNVRSAEFSIAGSGDLKVGGKAQDGKFKIAGSGDVDASGLQSRTATVTIAGSGSAIASASDTATISIMGSGDVQVKGTAKCSVSKLGSGDATCNA